MSTKPQIDNKKIAKNTLFLYFRTIIILIINLYASRVILKILGVDDYGIYNVVGGIVLLLSFVNSALSNGSSRFITYEMGKGPEGDVKGIFQSSFVGHAVLAFAILILSESIGLWFLYNELVIPPDRLSAAVFTFHCSVVTALVSITQVPYTALIIANEKMGIYAYLSIVEAISKLLVVYFLLISPIDRLEFYSILIAIVQIGVAFGYRYYCVSKYKESSLRKLKVNIKHIKDIVSFSGWSLFGNAAHALNGQGLTIITNMFFSPVVVTARALSIQVNGAVMHLIQNITTAANPQVVKLYSANEKEESKHLLLNTMRYSFLMMLLISVPLIATCKEIMALWLDEVPEYTVIFVQLILVQSLFYTFDTSAYIGLYACGRVKENALISPTLYFIQFIIIYLLFSHGYSPVSLSVVGIFTVMVAGIIVKPILLNKLANYPYKPVYTVIFRCLAVALVSFMLLLILYNPIGNLHTVLKIIIMFFVTLFGIITIGINRDEKTVALNYATKMVKKYL